MSSALKPHVGEYWRRKSDGTRVQVIRIWMSGPVGSASVAYDIFGTLPGGGPSKSGGATYLDVFLETYEPEAPVTSEDAVRRIVREELKALLAVLLEEAGELDKESWYDSGSDIRVQGLRAFRDVLDRVTARLAEQH